MVADFDATGYGADRSGRKDSTKAIQQALYDCQDAGGGTVWLPVGKYRVTDTLEVHAFCTLRGDRRDPDQGARRLRHGRDRGPRLGRRRAVAVPDRRLAPASWA